jgi:hypothetical protein
VNGPEILNKFVGASEENIRKLFLDAEDDYRQNGEHADLHIIIFDEIDAICKVRFSLVHSNFFMLIVVAAATRYGEWIHGCSRHRRQPASQQDRWRELA